MKIGSIFIILFSYNAICVVLIYVYTRWTETLCMTAIKKLLLIILFEFNHYIIHQSNPHLLCMKTTEHTLLDMFASLMLSIIYNTYNTSTPTILSPSSHKLKERLLVAVEKPAASHRQYSYSIKFSIFIKMCLSYHNFYSY